MDINEVNILSYACLIISGLSMVMTVALSLTWKICRAVGFAKRFDENNKKSRKNDKSKNEKAETEETEDTVLLE